MEIARIVMTLGLLQLTVVPLLADLNRSHAANPRWPGHARFHVVAQVLTTSAIGFAGIAALWSPRLSIDAAACLGALAGGCIVGGFFAAAVTARLYGGQVNGEDAAAGIRFAWIDGNVLNFGLAALVLACGRMLAMAA